MSKYVHHPKNGKRCVFCKFWIGDAQLKFRNSAVGYEYESSAKGKCTKKNGTVTNAGYNCNLFFEPNMDASRLL